MSSGWTVSKFLTTQWARKVTLVAAGMYVASSTRVELKSNDDIDA